MKSEEEILNAIDKYKADRFQLAYEDMDAIKHGREPYNYAGISQIDTIIRALEWVLDMYNARLP